MSVIGNEGDTKLPIYVILGSGGHTAEMVKINKALLKSRNGKTIYKPICYLVAKTDSVSQTKISTEMEKVGVLPNEYRFIEIPRSREVGQSWITTIFTTLWALLWSIWLVWRDRPRLILCNGPGTCVPFCVALYFWRFFGRLQSKSKIVFIESLCRVQTLSLSGRILLYLADVFVVQWPTLAERYNYKSNVKYFNRLM